MPKGELHVELAVNYADGSLAEVSRGARLLYVDALCLCKRTLNDGQLTRAQLEKLAFPDSRASASRQIAELVNVTALQQLDGGRYQVTAWLSRNKSRAQVKQQQAEKAESESRKAILGNHQRWHVQRGVTDPTCPHCTSPGDRNGIASGDRQGIPNDRIETETETETETTTGTIQHRVENRHAGDEPAGPPGRAEALLAEHRTAAGGKINPRALTELGGHIAELCRAGYDDDEIRAGLTLWRSRGVRPSSLPDLVDFARRNGARAPGTALATTTTPRPSTTDQRVGAGLDLAARYAAEGR